MDAIILSGGKATRMESELPKALVEVAGKPLICYQIDYFLKSGKINKIILALGVKAEMVVAYIEKHYPGKNIDFSIENSPLGTGGAIKQAMMKTNAEYVLVTNGDDVTDINLDDASKITETTIFVSHPRLPFGVVNEKEGYAVFEEKPLLTDKWVSVGWYVFKREEVLPFLPENGSVEYETFPKIKLKVFKHEGFWGTVNSKKEKEEFEKMKLPESLK